MWCDVVWCGVMCVIKAALIEMSKGLVSGRRMVAKALTERHHQEWSLRHELTQHRKKHTRSRHSEGVSLCVWSARGREGGREVCVVCGVESETSTWAILVSRTGDDPTPPSSPLLPPCVHSKRPRVYVQNVPVCCVNMPTCIKHVGMLPVHTGTF